MSEKNSSCISEISTQKLIEDGLSPSDYKENYSETSRSDYKCSKCSSSFSNKQTLDIHQKTSLKCGGAGDSSSTSSSVDLSKICQHCNKTFSSKQMRLYHETKCVDKIVSVYLQHINSLNDEIKRLKLQIEEKKI